MLKYKTVWNSDLDSSVSWNSRTIRSNKSIKRNRTINDPSLYNGEINHDRTPEEPTIQKFNTREESAEYFNSVLKDKLYNSSEFSGRGPTAIYIKRK